MTSESPLQWPVDAAHQTGDSSGRWRRPPDAFKKPSPKVVPRAPTESLGDVELLQLAMGETRRPNRSKALAHSLLTAAGGIGGLGGFLRARPSGASGLSAAQTYRLDAMLELGRRASRERLTGRRLAGHLDVQRWAQSRLSDLEHEEVWVLALDGSNRVRAEWAVGRGGLHGCGLLPADILRPVLRSAAAAMVLVHNHPSDDPTPSPEDVNMTRELVSGCRILGVTLLDHVVVSRSGSRSMAELGLVVDC